MSSSHKPCGKAKPISANQPEPWWPGPTSNTSNAWTAKTPPPYLDSNYAGLGLVDFSIVPHIDGPVLGESAAEIMLHSNSDDHMVPIRDDQAVLVNGPHVELVER